MSYLTRMDEDGKTKWNEFKQGVLIDRGNRIFRDPANMGNCSVTVSLMEGKLCLEIMPNETSNMNGDVEGVIVTVDENDCHVDSIMKMVENATGVEEAKGKGLPVKSFR